NGTDDTQRLSPKHPTPGNVKGYSKPAAPDVKRCALEKPHGVQETAAKKPSKHTKRGCVTLNVNVRHNAAPTGEPSRRRAQRDAVRTARGGAVETDKVRRIHPRRPGNKRRRRNAPRGRTVSGGPRNMRRIDREVLLDEWAFFRDHFDYT